MALTINNLEDTLQNIRTILLSATNGDGIVSRADFGHLLQQTENELEKKFIEVFYNFLLDLENRPRVRVTANVIDKGINFIREQIIPKFEIKLNFTIDTNQKITQIHESAFPMAMELIKFTSDKIVLNPFQVSEQIGQLTDELFFDDMGSEAGIPITSIFLEHPNQSLTPKSFVIALGLHPDIPKAEVSRFRTADEVLYRFIDKHEPRLAEKAKALVELMKGNLSDLKVIILGREYLPAYESNHPVYVVGAGKDGNLAGFESKVIWT